MVTVDDLLKRLTSLYNKEPSSNIYKLLDSIVIFLQEIREQDVLVQEAAWVDTATGVSLDSLGKLLDVPRLSDETDITYRGRLKSTVPGLVGGGTIEALKKGISFFLSVLESDIVITEGDLLYPYGTLYPSETLFLPEWLPAYFKVFVDLELAPHVHWEETKNVILKLKAAGVSFDLVVFDMIEELYPELQEVLSYLSTHFHDENIFRCDRNKTGDRLTGWPYEEYINYVIS